MRDSAGGGLRFLFRFPSRHHLEFLFPLVLFYAEVGAGSVFLHRDTSCPCRGSSTDKSKNRSK